MKCTYCKEYNRSMSQIISAQVLANLHGQKYTGKIFKFCPFCGNLLKEGDDLVKANTVPGRQNNTKSDT